MKDRKQEYKRKGKDNSRNILVKRPIKNGINLQTFTLGHASKFDIEELTIK